MKKIIVVEGRSDTRRLKEVYDNVITFETSGLGLDQNKINKLKMLQQNYQLVVFTDPDGPGEKIRKKLNDNLDNLEHAYLPNEKAKSKNQLKVGVEHATNKDIEYALKNCYKKQENKANYKISDLVSWGIYNNKDKRIKFCDKLHIAYGNNKKVIEQLNYFGISYDIIKDVLKEINATSIQ